MMDPGKIFQIITNSTLIATRLLSGSGKSMIEFSRSRYCAVVREDTPTFSDVITVSATHKEGGTVKYSISGGNTDGLFSIDEDTGIVSLAATLDYEVADTHELIVSGEGGGKVVHAIVQVSVTDVNDNAPVIANPNRQVTVIEEDDRHLPASLIKVEADDKDPSDRSNLRYSVSGDGVDGYDPRDAYFTVDRHTGDLIQLRALDRDPPSGKRIWKLRVRVEDGQNPLEKNPDSSSHGDKIRTENEINDSSWSYEGYQNDATFWSQLEQVNGGDTEENSKHIVLDSKRYLEEGSKESVFGERNDSSGVNTIGNVRTRTKWKTKHFIEMDSREAIRNFKRMDAKEKTRDLRDKIDKKEKSKNTRKSIGARENNNNEREKTWNNKERIEKEVQTSGMKRETASKNYDQEIVSHRTKELRIMRSVLRKSTDRDEKTEVKNVQPKTSSKTRPNKSNKKTTRQRRHQKNILRSLYESVTSRDATEKKESVSVASRSSSYDEHDEEYSENIRGFSFLEHSLPEDGGEKTQPTSVFRKINTRYLQQSQTKSKDKRKTYSWKRKLKDKSSNNKNQYQENISMLHLNNKRANVNLQNPVHGVDDTEVVSKSFEADTFSNNAISNDNSKRAKYTDQYATPKRKDVLEEKINLLSSLEVNRNVSNWQNPLLKNSEEKEESERSKYEPLENMSDLESVAHHWDLSSEKKGKIANFPPRSVGSKSRKEKSLEETFQSLEDFGSFKIDDGFTQWNHLLHSREEGGSSENSPLTFIKESSKGNSQSSFINKIGPGRVVSRWVDKHGRETDQTQKNVPAFRLKPDFPNSSTSRDFLMPKTWSDSSPLASSNPSLINPALSRKQNYIPESRNISPPSTTEETLDTGDIEETKTDIRDSLTARLSSDTILLPSPRDTSNTTREMEKGDTDASSNEGDRFRAKILDELSESNWEETFRYVRDVRNADEGNYIVRSPIEEEEQCPEPTASSSTPVNQVVHSAEATVTIVVKDINDNPPVFPNVTMFGEIQENGPADLSVAQVSAWDTDDATEGTNARITYSIEKNVIHDKSGDAIFSVHPQTGLITTALCCLDRETTPEYYIQVVATDGGGLKGTGTVVVRLSDENDNSPRLTRKSWQLEVNETFGEGPLDNATLLEMTAVDPDSKNDFSFRVIRDSGFGWDRFSIRSSGASGQLYAIKKLDYEDPEHLQGFKFMVQVTDRGEQGWDDPRHQDTAWVGVRLKDLNDNPPSFRTPDVHVTLSEDTAPGTHLLNMTAYDLDRGGGGRVRYEVLDGWDTLKVDEIGKLTLSRPLDRESRDGGENIFRIVAMDKGSPPLTSTGTLTITVTDVNDCPPLLKPPTVLQVLEGEPPVLLGVLTATDEDVWALGHGPPFTLSLAPSNPSHIQDLVELKFDRRMDSGRGGAELWSRRSLDREQHRELQVKVLVTDAGDLRSTSTVTVVVGDLNDNPMKPASKTVYLWKTQNTGSDAPLGRVYVDDPDDWDIADKTFQWAGKPHPLFTLNEENGMIYASSHLREGRYDLQFLVTDLVWHQVGVSANVSVVVKVLTQDALSHATPINLHPTTPSQLTKGWRPSTGGGILGKLIGGIRRVLGAEDHRVEIVSVYGTDSNPTTAFFPFTLPSGDRPDPVSHPVDSRHTRNPHESSLSVKTPSPYACLWVSAADSTGAFIDPVKLQGLLALGSKRLEEATGLLITFKDPSRNFGRSGIPLGQSWTTSSHASAAKGFETSGSPSEGHPATSTLKHSNEEGPETVASLASTVLPLQVVDTNATSLVTPLLLRQQKCPSARVSSPQMHTFDTNTCTASSCLNGGRCVPFPTGNRCVCPGGSKGPQCKVVSRTFRGNGWAWLNPLPSCLPATISFRLLTTSTGGLLLYSGPLVPPSEGNRGASTSMLTVQIVETRPELLVEISEESLRLRVNSSLSDGEWHTVHVRLDETGVALMVDLCGFGWTETSSDDSHCIARRTWGNPRAPDLWESVGPLQLGGLAQSQPRSEDFGWRGEVTPEAFKGCIALLTINDQVVDLGEPPYSQGSAPGCPLQESACNGGLSACGIRGECTGGLRSPQCQCKPGWSGHTCDVPTVPTTLGPTSHMKIALSFTPPSKVLIIQVRVRTLGSKTGMLLHLATQHTNNSLTLQLRAGIACASMSGTGWGTRVACVKGRALGDGRWHVIRAERHGHNLLAVVDDGDEGGCNHSIPSLTAHFEGGLLHRIKGPPMPLEIDKHDGVVVGGRPLFRGTDVTDVEDDLQDTCIDDLRVSGRRLPLPPAANGSSWGQVTSSRGLTEGCHAPSSCANETCEYPLSCHSHWMHQACSCGPGRHLVEKDCVDVDECLLQPCLHGGTCVNLEPGYECLCGPAHLGDSCEWTKVPTDPHPLTAPVVIGAVTFSFLLLVVLGVFLCLRHHRTRKHRAKTDEGEPDRGTKLKDSIRSSKSEEESTIVALDPSPDKKGLPGSAKSPRGGVERRKGPEDESHSTFLELLKLSRKNKSQELQGNGGGGGTSDSSGDGSGVTVALIPTPSEDGSGGPGVPHSACPLHQPLQQPLQQLHLPQEDLRNYAYEGDGSSSGSLTSAISGLQAEIDRDEGNNKTVAKEFVEVVDLLQNLPDAPKSSTLKTNLKQKQKFSLEGAKELEDKPYGSSRSPGIPRSSLPARFGDPPVPSSTFPARSGGPLVPSSGSSTTTLMPCLSPLHPREDKSNPQAIGLIGLPRLEKEGMKSTSC